ncbi:MAG TPA: tRNA preQ1(34) S-adenosylmethionine ribosyltransferase-isomerase QueA [Firmicutes bacterium]|nr:tRNA preQ1(34) S-adenosylmethionine ribosyltransferase-isomerase QueA [Bacillota bacterium]
MNNKFDYDIFNISEYDYDLPLELIAQSPAEKRDESRLLVLKKDTGELEDHKFCDIISYLKKGDVLVRNNTKVIPARLFGVKEDTGAHVELLLLHPLSEDKDTYEVLVGNAKVVKLGTKIAIGENHELIATCTKVFDEGIRHMKLTYEGILMEVLEKIGNMPLPPYIKKQVSSNDRYQTVYAKIEGSAAAPTAGFHFTPELLNKIKEMGVTICDVTLHVGLGTFRPVKVSNLKDHKMHHEEYFMDQNTADILNKAKEEKRRIISIGTTSTRTLETIYHKYNKFVACHDETDLFIYPGFEFKAVDALITNFHLPKSTLLMLVSAFCSRDMIISAYKHAIKEKYRFFSFGDAMFIF